MLAAHKSYVQRRKSTTVIIGGLNNRDCHRRRDNYILGELAASIIPAIAASAERRYRYHVLGVSVCAKVFKDVHGVGEHTLKRLKELVARGTAAVPQHGNVNFMPHNSLSPDTISKTVQFLNSYACTHGLPQPAAPRGRAAALPVYLAIKKRICTSCVFLLCRNVGLRTLWDIQAFVRFGNAMCPMYES